MSQRRRIETFNLWISPKQLFLEAPNSQGALPTLSISREASSPTVGVINHGGIPSTATKRTIHGVLGIIEMPLAYYLLVINRKIKIGDIQGHSVWRLESVEFIPLSSTVATSSTVENDSHNHCVNLVRETLATPYFYFSYTGDITNSLQRQHDKPLMDKNLEDNNSRSSDRRFVWNHFIANKFLDHAEESSRSAVSSFLVQIIHGGVFVNRCNINGKSFTWSLISRRSRFRTGTRFFSRGADSNGNVANFCETEQIIEFKDQVASHVQTRGSMPFLWTQTPCIKYMPKPQVQGSADQNKHSMKAHFHEQISLYGEQVIVNLINQVKYEGDLEKEFRKLVNSISMAMDEVHYEAFDFHKECSKMRYDRLILLSDQLGSYDFGYFHKPGGGSGGVSPILKQKGVFRTNCMDCLDRTNVVQAYLAAENLAKILASLGVLNTPSVTELEGNSHFQNIYRNAWADHGNLIAVQYAGTGALKTDYTRTGVRTHWGVAQDGWNASVRYVKNNFFDGDRTDGIKFFLGELTTSDLIQAQVTKNQLMEADRSMVSHIPKVMLGFLVFIAFILLSPYTKLSLSTVFLCLFSFAIIYGLFKLMIVNSQEFVNYPSGYRDVRT